MADADPFQDQGKARAVYHVSLGVGDIEQARAFYGAVLAPLGYRMLYAVEEQGRAVSLGWGLHWPELWTNLPGDGRSPHPGNGVHVAFHAPSKAAVDEFHRVGLASGGSDNGAPGYRVDYDPGYYGAFLLDPDRNRIEAMWLDPARRGE
jgi:catechol 2,3-dioxygenase-like lactoylglutathione lyase family enzyme